MKNIKQYIVAVTIGAAFAVGLAYAAPTQAPPGGNISAPINVSGGGQTIAEKVLTVKNAQGNRGGLTITGDIIIDAAQKSYLTSYGGLFPAVDTNVLKVNVISYLNGLVGFGKTPVRAMLDIARNDGQTSSISPTRLSDGTVMAIGEDLTTGAPAIKIKGQGDVINSGSDFYFNKSGGFAASSGLWFFTDADNNNTNNVYTGFHFSRNAESVTDPNRVELMTISENGAVGIGIGSSTPRAKLDIGRAKESPSFYYNNDPNDGTVITIGKNPNTQEPAIKIRDGDISNEGADLKFNSNGGLSADLGLWFFTNANSLSNYTGTQMGFHFVRNTETINSIQSGDELMTIKEIGKVGINVSNPISTLQIVGATSSSVTTAATTLTIGMPIVGRSGASSSVSNVGSCLELFDTAGNVVYAYIAPGATTFTLSRTVSCK